MQKLKPKHSKSNKVAVKDYVQVYLINETLYINYCFFLLRKLRRTIFAKLRSMINKNTEDNMI